MKEHYEEVDFHEKNYSKMFLRTIVVNYCDTYLKKPDGKLIPKKDQAHFIEVFKN